MDSSREENGAVSGEGGVLNIVNGTVGHLVQAGNVTGGITIGADGTIQVGGATVAPPAEDDAEGEQ